MNSAPKVSETTDDVNLEVEEVCSTKRQLKWTKETDKGGKCSVWLLHYKIKLVIWEIVMTMTSVSSERKPRKYPKS